MVYEMKLKKEPFQAIASGSKTVELRVYDRKRRKLDPGDIIIFTSSSDVTQGSDDMQKPDSIQEPDGAQKPDSTQELAVVIKALYRYRTFEELFSEISPAVCGYTNGETAEEAAAGMRQYYSEDQIRNCGVIGIRVERIPLEDGLKELAAIKETDFDRLFPDGMK